MKGFCNYMMALLVLVTAISCDGRLSTDKPGSQSNGPSMKVNVPETNAYILTKAGDDAVPTRVFGSEEDGFTISEYVYDMNAMGPITKGTEIIDDTSTSLHLLNASGQKFGVLAYYETDGTPTQPIASKGLDIDGSCSYSSSWSWDSSTKQHTTTYDANGNLTNNGLAAITTNDGVLAPCWRVKSTERIWSIYPLEAANRITADGAYSDLKNKISASDPSSFTFDYTVSTTLEDQQDLLFAYNKESRQWKQTGTAPDPRAWEWNDGTNDSFTVQFWHAMAAVKFQLSTTVPEGTNVHSITLCYVDASKNIVENVGVARYGECTVTGDDTSKGSCNVGFSWGNLDTKRPLHYTFADTYSTPSPHSSTVAGGYAKSGEGVMFMIPQTIPHTISTTGGTATLKIIVEFSKYGSSHYHTVISDFPDNNDVTWAAGYYYLYQLNIGEFHVPGELMSLSDVVFSGLKVETGTTGFLQPSSPMPTKGVSKVGLVIDSYGLGKKSDQYVYLGGVKDGVDQLPVSNSGGVQTPTNAATSFTYSFAGVSTDPVPNTGGQIYEFGLDGTTETYYSYYQFSNNLTDGSMKPIPDANLKGPTTYYVFDTTGADEFQVIFKPSAGSNDGGFKAKVRCMFILEVVKDANIPVNWDDFLGNLSNYL